MMNRHSPKWDADLLERRFDTACPEERDKMRPEIHGILRELVTRGQPVPRPLRRIERALEDDAFEEMFNNMPV